MDVSKKNAMVSFQPKIRSCLALAALALQLALSFAHVHLSGVYGSHYGTAITGAATRTCKLPAPEPTDSGNEDCAICASIQLAAGSLLPKALQLPTFFGVRTIKHAGYIALAIPAPRRTPFQPRAPPLA
jgi:hypothetical protein